MRSWFEGIEDAQEVLSESVIQEWESSPVRAGVTVQFATKQVSSVRQCYQRSLLVHAELHGSDMGIWPRVRVGECSDGQLLWFRCGLTVSMFRTELEQKQKSPQTEICELF